MYNDNCFWNIMNTTGWVYGNCLRHIVKVHVIQLLGKYGNTKRSIRPRAKRGQFLGEYDLHTIWVNAYPLDCVTILLFHRMNIHDIKIQ